MTHIGKTTWKFLGGFGVLVVFNLESTKTGYQSSPLTHWFYGYLNLESTKTLKIIYKINNRVLRLLKS